MSDWQDFDPRSANAMEELDNRRSYVGSTLVFSDRNGPYRFMRGGVEVDCVCDPPNMQCTYHVKQNPELGRDAASALPVQMPPREPGYWTQNQAGDPDKLNWVPGRAEQPQEPS